MKYIFLTIMTILAFFGVALFIPATEEEKKRDALCVVMYEKYEEELLKGLRHDATIYQIHEFCNAW
jgi:hypothetical protein